MDRAAAHSFPRSNSLYIEATSSRRG